MRIERYFFFAACVVLQAATPVFGNVQQEPASAVESDFPGKEPAASVDARNQEPVGAGPRLRGSASAAISGLMDAIHSSEGSRNRMLRVNIEKATALHGEDTFGTSDVYVKVKVYGPDETIGEDKTKVVKDLNPVYNEEFDFLLPESNPTDDMVLKLTVMDKDLVFDDKMGETKVKLNDLTLSPTPLEVVKVVDGHWFTADSKIYLTIALED